MKLVPSLTLATLCAAFAGCTATTQTIHFADQDGVTVTIDGTEIGTTPTTYQVERTATPTAFTVVFSKDGCQSEQMVVESWEDADGLCSFLDDYPVPELLPAEAPVEVAEVEEPAPAPEPVPAEEPEVVAVAEEVEEPVAAEEVEEPVVEELEDSSEIVAEEPVEVADEAVAEEIPEEPAVAEVAEPAPEPVAEDVVAEEPDVVAVAEVEEPVAEEPATEDVSAEEPAAEEPEPAPAEEPAPEPVAEEPVADEPVAEPEAEEPAFEPTRTLKDIENELKSLTKQRQNGQISEKQFQKACADLEAEVRARYGK